MTSLDELCLEGNRFSIPLAKEMGRMAAVTELLLLFVTQLYSTDGCWMRGYFTPLPLL
jgi:hypothetical protein